MPQKKSKKKNNNAQQGKVSPERYLRERARKLPIGKCFVTPDWEECGLANVIVTRVRPNGELVMGFFLVDTYCLGVKDAFYRINYAEDQVDEMVERLGLEETGYNEAHNLIYGALSFAENAGIAPAKDFRVTSYILEEDTEDVPLIEYEFGKDGKYCLIVGPSRKELIYLNTLKETLGDRFTYILPADAALENSMLNAFDNWETSMKESASHPTEPFSHEYPAYPDTLTVKNQFIADELLSRDNIRALPSKVIDRMSDLPDDEVAEDISNIILYEIGRTYKSINDKSIGKQTESAIMHSLLLLEQLNSPKALEAVLELMRQSIDFSDYHLGDFAFILIYKALYTCGKDNIPAILSYIYERGHDSYLRNQAVEALAMIAFCQPERRDEIIGIFRELLVSMKTRLPKLEACDALFAGSMLCCLCDLGAKELTEEIDALFDTGCVDTTICDSRESVLNDIRKSPDYFIDVKYRPDNIYEFYQRYGE